MTKKSISHFYSIASRMRVISFKICSMCISHPDEIYNIVELIEDFLQYLNL